VSKWRTFEEKMPLQILSFRVKLRCVPSKMLGRQVVARVLKGKVLQGFIFFLWLPLNFFFFLYVSFNGSSKTQRITEV
jgi:hypothetical protein